MSSFIRVSALEWIARLLSLASIAILSLFAMARAEYPVGRDWLFLAFFPCGVVLGMAIGWFRPLAGGLVTMASLAVFYALMWSFSSKLPAGVAFFVFALPGLLFLIAGLLHRGHSTPTLPITN